MKITNNTPSYATKNSSQEIPVLMALVCLLFLGNIQAMAQSYKSKLYRVWIEQYNADSKMNGLLYSVLDSSILVSPKLSRNDFLYSKFENEALYYNQIDVLKLRKKGKPGIYAAIGALSGFAVGIIIGFTEGDDPPCAGNYLFPCSRQTAGDKALQNGLLLGWLGGMTGAIIGSFKIKIPINGRKEEFSKHYTKLKNYSYTNSR